MAKTTIASLGRAFKEKRGDQGLRAVAAEIGVSPSTLTRVEQGNIPDLETFGKLCKWMSVDPNDFLGIERSNEKASSFKCSAHFKMDKTLSEETAHSLADLILSAQRAFQAQMEDSSL
jgi:transcriptional regulator with XRE-family HTH domain